MSEHTIDLAVGPERAQAALARTADLWGAELEPGTPRQASAPGGSGKSAAGRVRLRLPVTTGVRRGWAGGEVAVEPVPGGSRVTFRVDEGESRLQAAVVVILALGAAGGLLAFAWPFWPRLIRLAPIGVVLALAAWFLVSSRLRTSGPDEFLDMVAAVIGEEDSKTPT